MLMPKRVKRRKQHRGRMKGIATKGNSDRGCPCSNDKIHQERRKGLHQDLPT